MTHNLELTNQEIAGWISKEMELNSWGALDVKIRTGFSVSMVRQYKCGAKRPGEDRIKKLEKLFGSSPDRRIKPRNYARPLELSELEVDLIRQKRRAGDYENVIAQARATDVLHLIRQGSELAAELFTEVAHSYASAGLHTSADLLYSEAETVFAAHGLHFKTLKKIKALARTDRAFNSQLDELLEDPEAKNHEGVILHYKAQAIAGETYSDAARCTEALDAARRARNADRQLSDFEGLAFSSLGYARTLYGAGRREPALAVLDSAKTEALEQPLKEARFASTAICLQRLQWLDDLEGLKGEDLRELRSLSGGIGVPPNLRTEAIQLLQSASSRA